jgi:hypothetical protein
MESIVFLLDDTLHIQDLIERYEELESGLLACFNEQQTIEGDDTETDNPDDSAFQEWLKVTMHEDSAEFLLIYRTLKDLQGGGGGDEQWRGDWYPSTLIRDSYFQEYAKNLAEDCGMVSSNQSWPNYCIDWEYAAKELQYDYSATDIGGITYWFR